MAIFDHGIRNGIQLGKVGDRCVECARKHRQDEEYDPVDLDYKEVFKIWVNNVPHCLCLDCFKESLGNYILIDPKDLEQSEKPKAKKANTKKKEEKKDESQASEPSEGK